MKEVFDIAKLLTGNGMWVTKWILPEHQAALIEDDRHLNDFAKPVLDEQEIQMVDAVVRESFLSKRQAVLSIYDINKYRMVTGVVERVDHQLKRAKIILHDPFADEPDIEWIPLSEICKAELVEVPEWSIEQKEAYTEAENNDRWDELEWDRDEGP